MKIGMTLGDVLKDKTEAKPQTQKFWYGDVGPNDDFGVPITDEFVDGRTLMGPWAFMTPASHRDHGVGLGTGRGQRYQKQADTGRWLKVEG